MLPSFIAKVRARLVVRAPFYGSIALGLRWQEDASIRTMATDGRTIFFNLAWSESIGIEQAMGVVAHEVLHVVNKHHLRLRGRQRRRWNVAADLMINRVLTDGGIALPPTLLHDLERRFEGLSVETIYARLDDEAELQKPRDGEEDQPSAGQDGQEWGAVWEPRHVSGGALSGPELEQAEAEVDVRVRQAVAAAKRAGKLPAGLALMIEATAGRTDWRDTFRYLTDGLIRDGMTWARPNRRFLSHGLYLPSTACHGIGTVAVVLDTSGSIGEAELALYTGEVLSLLEEAMPEQLVLIQCDSQVRDVQYLEPGDAFERIEVKGRGGTRFQPAFDWIESNASEARVIVYMTDLCCCDPIADPGKPVLWLTPTGGRTMPFGEIVQVAV